jgi:hypothetical protein
MKISFCTKMLLGFVFVLSSLLSASGEANYVYHEQTTANPGCGPNYMSTTTPGNNAALVISWKVEYQNYTNQTRVYYTTDGSSPSGAFGVGSGTTQVLTGSYNCTFVSGSTVDVATATIPAQPAGTTVKYIISAWHSDSGNEIFANGPGTPCGFCGGITNNSSLATVFSYTVSAVNNVEVTSSTGSSTFATYTTLAAAITAINGGVIHTGIILCNVATGHTETAPAGGFSITATGTSSNTITFQKNGGGTNPTFTAGVGTSTTTDAIFKLIGSDYITIDGFILQESGSNTTTTQQVEWGIALLHASVTDGCQNNTIKNNSITLNKTNLNTFGIYSNNNHSATAIGTTQSVTNNTTGPSSYNKVYGNTITNVNMGIAFIGTSTAANQDIGNDIGGNSASTGNTITNWGGAAAGSSYISNSGTSYCIYLNHQIGENVSYNTITSATISGTSVTLRGIFKDYGTAATLVGTTNITNNTITITDNFTSGTLECIRTQGTVANTSTLNINNNTILNTSVGGASSSTTIVGIVNSEAVGTLNMNSNIIRGTTSTATTGGFTGVSNTGAVVTTINMNNNQIGNASGNAITFSGASSGTVLGVNNTGGASTAALAMTGNDIRGITHSVAGSSAHTYIINSATTLSQNISSNTFTNLNVNTTGNVTFISNSVNAPASGSKTINTNSIVTAFNKGGAGGTVALYSDGGSSTSTTAHQNQNNNFSNITVTGATTITGWFNNDGTGSTPQKSITGNTFNNWTCGSGAVNVLQSNFGGTTNVSSNTITNITGTGIITGYAQGSNGTITTLTIASNTITGLSSTGTGGAVTAISNASPATTANLNGNTINSLSSSSTTATVAGITTSTSANIFSNVINSLSCTGTTSGVTNGIMVTAGTTHNIYKNKIYDLQTTGAFSSTPGVNGIVLSGSTTNVAANVYNNLVGDLKAPASISLDAIRGISITASGTTSNYNVYYNTVLLAAVSSGAQFGTTGIFHTTSGTATSAALNLRNNIIVNNSTPNGASLSVAYRRSTTTLTNYGSTSNNNLFYAGTPGANRLIFYDGTNSDQTLAAFKTRVGPTRDAASVTENPTFLSTTGSSTDFLHIDPAVGTQIESGAATIATYTDDFDGNTRNVSTPDIGADEFTGTPVTPTIVLSANDIPAGNISQGGTNNPIYSFAIAVTVANANLTDLDITTTGSYVLADVTNLKVWYQTAASPFNSGTATLLSTYTNAGGAGAINFSPFTSQSISAGSTGYIFITADIPCGATLANTIAVNAVTTGNTFFAAGTPTGTTSAGNTQTIIGVTNNVTGAAASTASGASAISWTNPTGCYNEILIVARSGSANDGTPSGDGTAYTGSLTFGSGTALGSGFVVYKGSTSPQTVTGLTNGTTYYFKIFTRNGTTWSSGVEVSAVPALVYCTPSTSSASTYISNVTTTGGVTNLSNGSTYTTGGYVNYTAVTPTVSQYANTAVNFGVTIVGGTAGIAIWVDWNSNGVFTDSGENVYNSNAYQSTGTTNGSFTVPNGQAAGNYRMRVLTDYNATSPVPCSFSGTRGEAEDYIFTVTVPPVPTITDLGASSGCVGTSITINGTGFTGATASNVTIGGTAVTSITSNTGTQIVAVIASGFIGTGTVSVTTIGGTATYNSFTVNAIPTSVPASNSPICAGTTLNLTGGTNIGTSFSWTGPNGFADSGQNPAISAVTLAAAGTYTLVVSTGSCTATATTSVLVNPSPTGVTASASDNSICPGSEVDLFSSADAVSGTLLTENFNSGTGAFTAINNSTGGTPADAAWTNRANGYVYSTFPAFTGSTGNFVLTNSDDQGSGGNTSTILQSPAMNTVGFTTLSLSFSHYFNFYLSAPDSAIVEVSSNGTTWTKVQHYVTDQGSASAFATPVINLNSYVGLTNFYVRFRYFASYDYFWAIDNVSVTGTPPANTFSWTSNPSGFTSSLQNPTGVVPGAGSTVYTVAVTGSGCTTTASTTVTDDATPPAPPTGSTLQFCETSTVADLTATGSNIQWYDLASGGNLLSLSTTVIHNTHYYATQTVDGCESTSTLDVLVDKKCPNPALGSTTNITVNSASLSWTNSAICAVGFIVEYRLSDPPAPVWTAVTINTPGTTYNLTGLMSGKQYQWRVKNICDYDMADIYSGYGAPIQYFTTLAAATTWYQDADGDGKGNPAVSQVSVTQPVGYVANSNDCDDTSTFPCPKPTAMMTSGITDVAATVSWTGTGCADRYRLEYRQMFPTQAWTVVYPTTPTYNFTSLTPGGGKTYQWRVATVCTPNGTAAESGYATIQTFVTKYRVYQDTDMDGFGSDVAEAVFVSTIPQAGYASNNTDCNDNNANIKPGAAELCNEIDDDCDGTTDEGAEITWYEDSDTDGLGNAAVSQISCTQPLGYVSNNVDCNDTTHDNLCSPPTNVSVGSIGMNNATISWTGVSCAIGYNVMYRNPSGVWSTTVTTTSTSYVFTGLTANTTYQARVRARCPSPNPTATSAWVYYTFTTSGAALVADMDAYISMLEPGADFDFEVYPNPGDGRFNLRISSDTDGETGIFVTDGFGKLVYATKWSTYEGLTIDQLDLSHLSGGVYQVSIQQSDMIHTKKIVIVK